MRKKLHYGTDPAKLMALREDSFRRAVPNGTFVRTLPIPESESSKRSRDLPGTSGT